MGIAVVAILADLDDAVAADRHRFGDAGARFAHQAWVAGVAIAGAVLGAGRAYRRLFAVAGAAVEVITIAVIAFFAEFDDAVATDRLGIDDTDAAIADQLAVAGIIAEAGAALFALGTVGGRAVGIRGGG